MVCARCDHDILPGQLWRSYPVWSKQGKPAHVACPTAREVQTALLWGRWM
jgi:hypothetical protein